MEMFKPLGPRAFRSTSTMMAIMMVLALVAVACGDSGDGSTSDAAAEVGSGDELILDGEVVADADTWEGAQEEGGLTLYTGWGADNEAVFAEEFEEDTGLTVEVVRLPAGRLLERIASERAADIYAGDVFRMGEQALIIDLVEEGAIIPHRVSSWDELADEYRFDDGTYYNWMQSAYSVGYNSRRVNAEEAPTSWEDLLDPKWRGDLAIPDIAAGGSTLALYQFVREEVAPDYWERLAENEPLILGGSGPVTEELARGEVAVAMVLPGSISPTMAEGAPIDWIVPEEGLVLYENFMGLMDRGPNPNAAKVFMNYVLSLRGQGMLAQRLGVYPVREDAPAPVILDRQLPGPTEATLWVQDLEKTLQIRDDLSEEWYEVLDFSP